MNELKPGIKEWAKIRARKAKYEARSFRFWYETKSGTVIATDVMVESEALDWLAHNNNIITSLLISERLTSKEAFALISTDQSDADEDDGVW